ncbi:MAG TPA: hypothetical protein VGF14_07500 [Alphaproteobacteria bacterium]
MANQPALPPPVKSSAGKGLFVAFIFTVGAIMLLPTTLVLAVGLLPTFVATFSDNSRERLAGLTLGCMNVAGVLPPLLRLWNMGHTVENAILILLQPYMLLLMYGGAAIGFLLYINTPLMVSGILRRQAQYRLKTIEKHYAELQEEWGPEVANISLREQNVPLVEPKS